MAEQVPHADKPDTKHVHDERDLCPCREEERAKYFSEGCNKHVCSKCSSGHIDHDEKKLHQITDEISSLRGPIEHQINKLEGFGEGLKAKENEMAAKKKELCGKIDIQVQNVCDEATRIGENMKEKVKTALDDLKAIVPMVESLDQLRQKVKDCGSRKMVIPDEPVIEFEAGEIDRVMLSKQVGRLVGNGKMFEVWFDVNDISEKGKGCSREIEYGGMTWRVGVLRCLDGNVVINLKPTKTPQGINVVHYIKLVNIKDDHQSVDKNIEKGQWSRLKCKWDQLTDKKAGFIDDKNQFKIQVELKILQ